MRNIVKLTVSICIVFMASTAFAWGLPKLGDNKASAPSGGPSISDLCALFDGASADVCDAGFCAVKGSLALQMVIAKDEEKDKIKAQLEKCNSCTTPEDKKKLMDDAATITQEMKESVDKKEFEKTRLTSEQLKEMPKIGRNSLLVALRDKRAIDQLMRVKDCAMGVINGIQSNPLAAVREAKNISKLTAAITVIPNMIDSAGKQMTMVSTTGSAIKQLTVGNKIDKVEEPKVEDKFE